MSIAESQPEAIRRAQTPRLGEELPVFCERCGYSLHALPPIRCEQCNILQFVCPECGHHQPINTLRPAVQRLLGRLHVAWLVAVVLFKINFFGWLLFGWFVMGAEWIYVFTSFGSNRYALHVGSMRIESWVSFVAFALGFGMFGRLLLIRRFRSGVLVGLGLGILAWLAVALGAWFRAHIDTQPYLVGPLWSEFDFLLLMTWTIGTMVLGSVMIWPMWAAMVWALLPKYLATPLLHWQTRPTDKTLMAIERAGQGISTARAPVA